MTEVIRDPSGGANQSGMRNYNERLLLSMLQRNGPAPGSDLARRAGLSPQTVSVILRKLENDGLVTRGEPVKGKVGKPFVPMRLAADGVLSLGLKIGRRTADLVLMDFQGQVRTQLQMAYSYPLPPDVLNFLRDGLAEIECTLTARERARICGLGIAAPFEMWQWSTEMGAPEDQFLSWQSAEFDQVAAALTGLVVSRINDATAACQAEHVFGQGKEFRDFAYFYVGAFVGGGIVLNHSVYEGHQGNAGALGSLRSTEKGGRVQQLIDTASLYLLEAQVIAAGFDRSALWRLPQDWSSFEALVDVWIDRTAGELAKATLSTCAVIDFEAILIDGAFPDWVKHRLVAQVRAKIGTQDIRGLIPPRIEAGQVGPNARAIGAAYHPVFSRFLLNTNA